jgi:cap1 methyltransferase
VLAVHIIDVLMIYGEDLREHHFNDRMERLKKFTKAVNKPSRSDLAPIRVKDIFKLEQLEEINERSVKNKISNREPNLNLDIIGFI